MHPDLKIKIPRAQRKQKQPLEGYAPEYWDLVRRNGKSRKAMVDFICGIGGYQTRWDHFAISFNIRAHHANLGADHLWKLLTSGDVGAGPGDLCDADMAKAKAQFYSAYDEHASSLWIWGCEEAYENWKDSDTPYETFAGVRIDWEWEIQGRSGGQLCMTECAGISLRSTPEDLQERLMWRDAHGWAISHTQVRDLFIICVQNFVDITPKNIGREIEIRAAWRLWVSFCEDELQGLLDSTKKKENLPKEAGIIVSILDKNAEEHGIEDRENLPEIVAFRAICELAGVTIEPYEL